MGASYDSEECNPPQYLPGMQKKVLEKIETCVKTRSEHKSILWLHGPTGAGKLVIARTVIKTCARRGKLAASFFFTFTAASRNALKHLFSTIAIQIAFSLPETCQKHTRDSTRH